MLYYYVLFGRSEVFEVASRWVLGCGVHNPALAGNEFQRNGITNAGSKVELHFALLGLYGVPVRDLVKVSQYLSY